MTRAMKIPATDPYGDDSLILELRQILAEETDRSPHTISGEEIRHYLELLAEESAGSLGTLPAVFENQVERSPAATAVVFGDQRLSYDQLNRQANRLAHYLRRLGVGPGVRVAICVERSPDIFLSILGVLKAGGAYLPLDPAYPQERLAFMIEDSAASLLLTRSTLSERFAAHRTEVVCLDAERPPGQAESDANPPPACGPEDLVYVIYTSGSTGRPKGTMIHHRNLCYYLAALRETLPLTEDDVFLLTSSFGFSASHRQTWLPLSLGAPVVVASADQLRNPPELLELVKKRGVTVLDIVPSYWGSTQQILSSLPREKVADLLDNEVRFILTASEPLFSNLPQAWKEDFGHAAGTYNLCGQTETTGIVTAYPVPGKAHREIKGVPVGKPLAGTRIYLLDPRLQLSPFGVPGHLHVSGPSLSSGYLGRARLTAERFIPDPFSDEPGDRLYRTGDRARYLADENLEFLGRLDQQVKIHGMRVEPGEVEGVLSGYPGVRQAAVVAAEDASGYRRLVAYLVGEPDRELPATELRSFLSARVPDFMVPSVFLTLDRLPLTATGKVDRRALPRPEPARLERDRELVPPRNRAESELARIWCQALGLDQVGVHDNFFRSGGDSILAIQVIARANQAGLALTPRQIMQHQTIAEMAAAVGAAPAVRAEQGLVTGPLPLSPAQHQFFERRGGDPNHFNQAVILALQQHLEARVIERALHRLLVHHDALRLRFEKTAEGWRQTCAGREGTVPPFSLIELAAVPANDRRSVLEAAAAAAQKTLHLSRGPLLRVVLFRLGNGGNDRLLIIFHHLVVDGLSLRITLGDLHTLCRQIAAGEKPRLPPKTTSFKAYAQRLCEHGCSPALRAELDYWLADGRAETRPLPLDTPAGDRTASSERAVALALTREETRALRRELPRALDVSTEDLLLTALLRALAPWTGCRSLRVDLVGHGREPLFEDVDLSRTTGWIGDSYPVTLDLGQDDEPLVQLRSIRAQLRRVPNRGIGRALLRYLSGDGEIADRLRQQPEPEVLLSYWGDLDEVRTDASALFELAEENAGPTVHPRLQRPWILIVSLDVLGERLRIRFRYSAGLHRRATIERLAHGFADALRLLIAANRSGERQAR